MTYPEYLLKLYIYAGEILERMRILEIYKSFTAHIIFLIILVLLIGIWTVPWPLHMPSSGLDPSWVIGINIAASDNLQFGQDIAFTFGPLGYLYNPSYTDHTLWFQSFLFTLFVHFLFVFSIALLMNKSSVNWKEYIVVFPLLLIPIHFIQDSKLLLSVVILLYLIATHKFKREFETKLLPFITILLAIASLIKFNMLITGISILAAFTFICVRDRYFQKALTAFISYIVFVSILWIITSQHIINLPVYLLNGYRISSGYSDAMAVNGPEWQIYVGLIGVVFAIILFIYISLKRKDELFIFILLSMGLLFLAFKHGFVRHDGHVYGFFAVYSIFFVCAYIICKNDTCPKVRVFSVLLSILFVACIYNGFPSIMEDNVIQKIPAYELSWSLISNQTYQTQVSDNAKNNIKHDYPLDNKTIQYLNGKTVDIFPWDIALVWAYDFNWSPRPIFQSYSAYTPHLDDLNAQHFSKGDAPQAVLYSYKSIDGRYPIFDEPHTFANILHNYTFVNKSGEFILLALNTNQSTSRLEEDLGTLTVELGQPIEIPKYDSGYVFGHIELEYSTFGKLMKFIYKPAFAHIRFKFYDSMYSNDYRFIPGTSKNGVFLSQYIGTLDDLASVFSGSITQDITEIIIDVDNPIYYKKYIRVDFVGIPFNISIQNISNPMPEWQVLKHREGGIMAIDMVDNRLYSNEDKIVKIDKKANQYIEFTGWAADDLSKDGTVKTYLVLKSEGDEIIVPTRKTYRPDVVDYFGVESYKNSGWTTAVQTRDFKDECYNISLRILRTNGEEYFELSGDKPICFS